MIYDFEFWPYVCDEYNNVFRYSPKGYFLKVTPWNKSEDRRYSIDEIKKNIENGNLKQYKAKSKIHEIINSRWKDERIFEWEYNGMKFKACVFEKERDYSKIPLHSFKHTYKDINGNEHSYENKYRIVFFNGKIYWSHCYHYYPQTILIPFESLDKEPGYTEKTHWTNVKNVRAIFNKNTKEFI